ncbi:MULTISPECIES: Uma2 family endonuclease [unclassified Sphingomonas]|uniref:Uma2 family endonuclease n=1 Tax=unclassified Sphingomonas TaxID=196159 RepID=UPI002269D013|nr:MULTISPECIES: Uma2 family endonuclease [unclassified Sphingomonas]
MATDQHYRLLTAEEFLRIDFGPDMKAELDNGVIQMMAGGTRSHARVQGNLFVALGNALRGSGCRPYGSDMAVRTHDRSVRYPDLTIDRGAPGDRPDDLTLSDPRVVIEILSPSTRRSDLSVKKDEYRAIGSVDTIAFIDPEAETLSVHQRIENGWMETLFSDSLDLALPSLGLNIPRGEIFADD